MGGGGRLKDFIQRSGLEKRDSTVRSKSRFAAQKKKLWRKSSTGSFTERGNMDNRDYKEIILISKGKKGKKESI